MITGYNARIVRVQAKILEIRGQILDLRQGEASQLTDEQKAKIQLAADYLDDVFNQLLGSGLK